MLRSLIISPLAGVIVILAAFLSFFLNRRKFRVSRLLILLLFVGMFLFAARYVAFAVLAAGVVLALNGQEWYLDRFGTETRITKGWWIWSQAGRAVTVLAVVVIAIATITGWLGSTAGGDFGYGIQWAMFDLEPGKLLRHANLKGKVVNTIPVQGNLLIWSNYPPTQVYLDSRDLHRSHLKEFDSVKFALRDDDEEVLNEFLDKYEISHVILNITNIADTVAFPRTFTRMQRDSKWHLVQLSANSALFGRADLPSGHPLEPDAAWFAQNSFDPVRLAFTEHADPLPEPPGPVTPPNWVDIIWRRRPLFTPQAIAADHYLTSAILKSARTPEEAADMGPVFVVPSANCFLAIRDARRGLAKETRVSPLGYSVLSRAYFYLYNTERMLAPTAEVHDLRALQVVTALNQWVAANPDEIFAQLHLALRYRVLRYLDLADRHMDALLKILPDDIVIEDFLFDGGQRFNLDKEKLKEESERIKDELSRIDYDMEQLSTQLTNPVAKANYLAMRGCPARAIELLNESAAFGVGMDLSPMLARLYLRIGQPGDTQRGADQQMVNMQGSGGMRPGEKEELWALVKLTQGDYDRARSYMEAAIAETRINLTKETLMSVTGQLRGGSMLTAAFGPADSVDDVDRLVRMEQHLGMIHLEAGEPGEAAKHFKQTVALRPDSPFRPVTAFYLERITGEKLEPLPDQPEEGEMELPGQRGDVPSESQPARPAEAPAKPDND
jgi:tetratricopeptide (TPR) repeat protein